MKNSTIAITLLVGACTLSLLFSTSFHVRRHELHKGGHTDKEDAANRLDLLHWSGNHGRNTSTWKKMQPSNHNNRTTTHRIHDSNDTTSSSSAVTAAITTTSIIANVSDSANDDSACFPLNSQAWLDSPRIGNQRNLGLEYVTSSVLNIPLLFWGDGEGASQKLMRQTLCHNDSLFVSTTTATAMADVGSSTVSDAPNRIHFLALRLLYLAIHVHQHRHAIPEATLRSQQQQQQQQLFKTCHNQQEALDIGPFDFECPDAKFLVVPMKHRGLGAIVRLDVATAFWAAMASDRVVLFVNHSPVGPKFLKEPWMMSSCDRRDKQCFFLPDSPCVVTLADIQNATTLARSDKRGLFRHGRLPADLDNNRVVLMDQNTRPQRTPANLYEKVVEIIDKRIIDPWKKDNPRDPRLSSLSAALHYIQNDLYNSEQSSESSSFHYFGRHSPIHHAMVFYAMRPRIKYAQKLDGILLQTFEGNHNVDLSLGLPIRASDKCLEESECIPFEEYMSLMQTVWEGHGEKLQRAQRNAAGTKNAGESAVDASIVLTTEAKAIYDAQEQYEALGIGKNLSFSFKFIKNAMDVQQDTGDPKFLELFNKEEIILSSLASLQMQLRTSYSVGNCCSNFHLLMRDYLMDGCGASHEHIAQCMQDHDDPRFRLCCAWDKREECKAKKFRAEATKNETLKGKHSNE